MRRHAENHLRGTRVVPVNLRSTEPSMIIHMEVLRQWADMPRPIAAPGAMPLSVSGIIPSRLLLQQGSSWVGPGVPQARAAAELTLPARWTRSSLAAGLHGPAWAGTKINADRARKTRVKRAASFAVRNPSGRQPGISAVVASEARRGPAKLGALHLARCECAPRGARSEEHTS